MFRFCFFFNDTPAAVIYTLSLHDALPIWRRRRASSVLGGGGGRRRAQLEHTSRACIVPVTLLGILVPLCGSSPRSEEHTSELQSQSNLVCRLLLEKKKNFI